MALDTPRDLFLHELGSLRDGERGGAALLGWMADQVIDDDLRQLLCSLERDSGWQLDNISLCLRAFGSSPLETHSATVNGIRQGFQEFVTLRPSADVLDLFALDTTARFMHFAIASYTSLITWAELLGKDECVRYMRLNLGHKMASVDQIEQVSRGMSERMAVEAA